MAFADAIKYNRIRSMKGLPIGAIIPWSSDQSTIPPGWIVCNGSTVSNTRYPILFKIIGNAYGGTVGSTFRLPPLTSGSPSIVDVFRGHYVYFKGSEINALPGNEVNRPTSTSDTLELDPFWNIVGRGTNGDTGSNSQTFWISTVDLVGQENSTSVEFQAIYDDIEVSDGSFFFTANYTSTSLGVEHLPTHLHGDPSTDPTSYDRQGGRASGCEGTGRNDTCNIGCDPTPAFRVAANPAVHVRVSRGNNQTHLVDNFLFTQGPFTGTGGGGRVQTTTDFGETNASVYIGGDGRCAGNMNCGDDVTFTSLSHAETNAGAPHFHGPNNYNMQGRYQVVSPGLRSDIALNTVRINNAPGQNFGTISVDTTTPSLEMLYIIRAY
jgi:hypothetical protein